MLNLGAFKIEGVDTKEFQKQIQSLQEQILNGKNKEKFLIINGEAGLGKTLYSEQALAELAKQGRKAIFVRKFVEDCQGSAMRINRYCQKEVATAIHVENYQEYRGKLDEYNIVIITHKRYTDLSKNKAERRRFTKGREVLVIDEEIDMLQEMTYSVQRIREFDELLERGIVRELYTVCTREIENYLQTTKGRSFFRTSVDVSKEMKQLKNIIKNSRLREFVKAQNFIYDGNVETAIIDKENKQLLLTKSDFVKEIEVLENFINYTCYVENSFMYSFDRQIKFWKLENNIILDASASVNYIYEVGKEFNLQKDRKVVNHSNWTMNLIHQNASKTNKEKTKNLYDVLNNEIFNIEVMGMFEKTLVVGAKEEQPYIRTSGCTQYAWFGNITGKNDWKDFTRIFIIHNPQYPFHTYVSKYLLYAGEDIVANEDVSILRDGKVVRFRSAELEKLRQTTIAAEIYQAIKRINRLNRDDAEVYLMNNDIEIVNLVINQFQNIKVQEYQLEKEIKYKETKMDKYNQRRKEDSYATAFIKLLSELDKGKYKKSWLREQIGHRNHNTFARDVLNQIEVAEYMAANNIANQGQSIIIH